MWKKLMAAAVITGLMCVLTGEIALAEAADTMTTKVTIRFYDAERIYDFGMDTDFDEQTPLGATIRAGHADDGETILRVCGRRVNTGRWRVDAQRIPSAGLPASGGDNGQPSPRAETIIWTLTLTP